VFPKDKGMASNAQLVAAWSSSSEAGPRHCFAARELGQRDQLEGIKAGGCVLCKFGHLKDEGNREQRTKWSKI